MSKNEQEAPDSRPRQTDLLGENTKDTTRNSTKSRAKGRRVERSPARRAQSLEGDSIADRSLFDREIDWPTWVYVIGADDGPRKIGYSTQPARRLSSLKKEAPKGAVILHGTLLSQYEAVKVEARAHQILADRRSHGEWFNVSTDEAIAAVVQATTELEFWGKHVLGEEVKVNEPVPCTLSDRQIQFLSDLARDDRRSVPDFLSRLVVTRLVEIEAEKRERKFK